MSKGLEILKEIKSKPFSWKRLKDSLDIIEKELKESEQYKAIEKELGIDLVTLIKALKGIYIKPNNIYVGSPYLCFAENENRELEFQFKVVDTWYKVNDYGKTWALTKEELL